MAAPYLLVQQAYLFPVHYNFILLILLNFTVNTLLITVQPAKRIAFSGHIANGGPLVMIYHCVIIWFHPVYLLKNVNKEENSNGLNRISYLSSLQSASHSPGTSQTTEGRSSFQYPFPFRVNSRKPHFRCRERSWSLARKSSPPLKLIWNKPKICLAITFGLDLENDL